MSNRGRLLAVCAALAGLGVVQFGIAVGVYELRDGNSPSADRAADCQAAIALFETVSEFGRTSPSAEWSQRFDDALENMESRCLR